MTASQESQAQEQKPSDKELNFRALEQKYQKQLEQERQARLEAEKIAQEAQQRKNQIQDDEEDDSDPYIDHKKLGKKLDKFGNQIKQQTQSEIKQAVAQALQEERQANWLKANPDFKEVMGHAQKFWENDQELAETILEMPDTFERQKLVYKNIKALGLHKPAQKVPTIQEKVDANKRSPYYQPSGTGSAPYSSQSDFSAGGQKQAYDKMQELKNRLRLG
jgi:hypothetical protein